jgi:hypothetical protein
VVANGGSKNKKTLLAADELLLKLDINPIEIHFVSPGGTREVLS